MPLSRQFEERIAGSDPFQLMDMKVTRMSGPLEYPRLALVFLRPAQHLNDVGTVGG
jgi:hypothetical protein